MLRDNVIHVVIVNESRDLKVCYFFNGVTPDQVVINLAIDQIVKLRKSKRIYG